MGNQLHEALNTWRTIASLGAPAPLWHDLAKQDLSNVLKGGSPMSRTEVIDAVVSAAKGSPVVNKQDETPSNPLDIAGNFLSDIGNVAWNFVPAVAHYVTSLPEQISDLPDFISGDPATLTKYGVDANDTSFTLGNLLTRASKVPVLGATVPVIHTAGQVASGDFGEIAKHPGIAALDVLPGLSEGARVASGGAEIADLTRTARAATRAGDTEAAAAARTAADELRADPFSARASFQQGRFVRGTMRAIGDLTPGFSRRDLNMWLSRAGVTSDVIRGVTGPLNVVNRQARREMEQFVNQDWVKSLANLDEPRRAELADFAFNYKPADTEALLNLPSSEQAIVNAVLDFNEKIGAESDLRGETAIVPTAEGDFRYSTDSDVVKTMRRSERANSIFETAQRRLDSASAKLAERKARLTGSLGKVRGFMEPLEDFTARAAGPVGMDAIRSAVRPLVESFREGDPYHIYGQHIEWDNIPKQSADRLRSDIDLLAGENGLMSQLDAAMQAGDMKLTRRMAREIHGVFRHDSWNRTPFAGTFRNFMKDIREEITGLHPRARSHNFAQRLYDSQLDRAARAQSRYDLTKAAAESRQLEHVETTAKTPPASMYPLLDKTIRNAAADQANVLFTGQQLQDALRTIAESSSFQQLKALMPDWEMTQADFMGQWLDLAAQGYNPIWIRDVNSATMDSVLRPGVLREQYHEPAQFHDTVFNMGRSMHDVYAGVTSAASELIREKAASAYIDKHLMPRVRDFDQLESVYKDMVRRNPELMYRGENIQGAAKRLMEREAVPFNPERYGFTKHFYGRKNMWIDKGTQRSLDLIATDNGIPIIGANSKLMKLFRYAVLTGPRHIAHVIFGGAMFGAVSDPLLFTQLRNAGRILSDHEIPVALDQSFEMLPDHAFNYAAGKTIGRTAAKVFGTPARYAQKLEENFTRMYKVSAMLSGEAKGLTRDEAIIEANKLFVDMDNMSAVERVYLKQLAPFYAFTKHLLRYMLNYPVDHPFAASTLARISNQFEEEWATGLPASMMMMLSLGSSDENGSVPMVELRSLNPFRSLYNEFTLAGVMSQLNPALTILPQMAGLNVLSATPELYPQLDWDEQTGQFVARHDPMQTLYEGLNAFVPEFGVVDHFVGMTDRIKALKETDPQAYERQLWSSLNLPFSKSDVNVAYEIERNERKRFKVATDDVSAALKSNDFSGLKGYDTVPVPAYLQDAVGSRYASPADLAQVWGQIVSQLPSGVSGKAVVKR